MIRSGDGKLAEKNREPPRLLPHQTGRGRGRFARGEGFLSWGGEVVKEKPTRCNGWALDWE